MSLITEINKLTAAPRDEMIDSLVTVAKEKSGEVGFDAALRSVLNTAYDVGRLALAQQIFKRNIEREFDRLSGTVQ